jgi:protein ImuB
MLRRVLAIALPLLPVELARTERDDEHVCMGVLDGARHPTLTTLDRAAATLRLDAVSPSAWREGIRPGQTLASATAKLSSLELRLLPAGAMEQALVRLAEAFLALSPQVATCMHPHVPVVMLDAQGLLERDAEARERELAAAMRLMAAELGHQGRVAVADGPWAAEALARYGKTIGLFRQTPVFHGPWRASGPLLGRLPLAALELGEAHEAWLAGLGLHTLGALAQAPRRELTVRLGERSKLALERLAGIDNAPLPVFHLEESPHERHGFEDECHALEPMLFALRGLASRLAVRLFGRGMATRALVVLFHGAGGSTETVRVELPAALHRTDDIFAVLRARLTSHRLAAPVRELTLQADLLVPRDDTSGHLFRAEGRGELSLPRLLGELESHHGSENVGFLQVSDAWRPEDRSRLLPASARPNGTHEPRLAESFARLQPFEPLRVFAAPVPVEPLEVLAPYMHLESPEWWRYGEEADLLLDAARGGEGAVALVEHASVPQAANENGSKCDELTRLWGWFG